MGNYILRRLMIAIPSLLGISVVLFCVLALAPGDPFEELATNPNVPPEVRAALRQKFGMDDPVFVRYFHWLAAMAQGDWGFSFVSRVDVDKLILQRLPSTLFVIGLSQVLALCVAIPVGVYAATRPYSLYRPDRQHPGLHRVFAAHLLHRAAVHSPVLDHTGLAAICLSLGYRGHWLALVLGAFPAGDHANLRSWLLSGRLDDALCALGGAGRDPA